MEANKVWSWRLEALAASAAMARNRDEKTISNHHWRIEAIPTEEVKL